MPYELMTPGENETHIQRAYPARFQRIAVPAGADAATLKKTFGKGGELYEAIKPVITQVKNFPLLPQL